MNGFCEADKIMLETVADIVGKSSNWRDLNYQIEMPKGMRMKWF